MAFCVVLCRSLALTRLFFFADEANPLPASAGTATNFDAAFLSATPADGFFGTYDGK